MSRTTSERVFAALGTFVTFGYKSKWENSVLSPCLGENEKKYFKKSTLIV